MLATSIRSRRIALIVSWLAYATYYLGRKGFSVAKASIAREHGLATSSLAWIDSGYLAAYALGQVPSGIAADRRGARVLLAGGMLLSAAACAGMSVAHGAIALGLCFTLNGAAQATGWPGSTKVVAQWTDPERRGRVMGVWSTCYQVGGIAATALATWLLAHYGWRAAFRAPAAALVLAALGVSLMLPRAQTAASTSATPTATIATSDWQQVLRQPLLYCYGACYFCIKLIRYSLLFWLPYYLHVAAGFDEVTSGYLSTGFEIGGTLGSVGLGMLSDRGSRSRAQLAALSLLGLAAALTGYAHLGAAPGIWHFGCLAIVGALLFGPDALISGAAAQDAAGTTAAGTAVGIVNGLGSAGALLQGPLTVSIERTHGWSALLHVFVGLALISALCLAPAHALSQRNRG